MNPSGQLSSGDRLEFLETHDQRRRAEWDEAVQAWDGGTVFHTTAWMDVVRRGLGLPPRFAYLAGPQGELRALVPLFQAGGRLRSVRWFNAPQSVPSDPLAAEPAHAERLVEKLADAASRQQVSAILLRTSAGHGAPLPRGWVERRESPVVRHRLSLQGAQNVESLPRARKNHRQAFRTLRRRMSDLGVQERRIGPGEAKEFTRLVHRCLLRSFGHLPYPVTFFRELLERLPDHARLAVIEERGSDPLGFYICIASRPNCYLIWLGGLATPRGKEAGRFAMGLAIESAIREGLETFDMGETGPAQDGLLFYKDGWGADRVDGSYRILGRSGAASGLRVIGRSHAWALPALRRLPIAVALWLAGPVHRTFQ